MTKSLNVLQFTDTHLYATSDSKMMGIDTFQSCSDVIDLAIETSTREGSPDFVLLTGDMSQDETPESYDRMFSIMERIGVPIYYLPGNHDQFKIMTERATPHVRHDRDFIAGDWHFVLLNSTREGRVEGYLTQEELERLDACMAKHKDKHTLVALHHNPVPVYSPWMDDMALTNPGELFEVLSKHSNLKVVIWGHVHQEFHEKREDIIFMSAPSTCVQFKPKTSEMSLDEMAPGFRRIVLNSDGTVKTAVTRLNKLPDGLILEAGQSY